jgi:hypothetical protein
VTGPDPITRDDILEGAEATCPDTHRFMGRATRPPCGDCYAKAESVLRAALPGILRRFGIDLPE